MNKALARQSGTEVSHNLLGQRLGRKGQETRERVLATALRLIESPQDNAPLTLSAVAREASVGMTTLYLYFPDLGDLVLAVLNRVMDGAGAAFEDQLRTRWPDNSLQACVMEFLHSHHDFWVRHARLLQMRDSYADAGEPRLLTYRTHVTRPVIDLFVRQMDQEPDFPNAMHNAVATILVIGLERLATAVTSQEFYSAIHSDGVTDSDAYINLLLNAEAEVMTLSIRNQRDIASARRNGLSPAE